MSRVGAYNDEVYSSLFLVLGSAML